MILSKVEAFTVKSKGNLIFDLGPPSRLNGIKPRMITCRFDISKGGPKINLLLRENSTLKLRKHNPDSDSLSKLGSDGSLDAT